MCIISIIHDSILLISIIDRVGSPLEINRDAVSSYPENIVNDDEI